MFDIVVKPVAGLQVSRSSHLSTQINNRSTNGICKISSKLAIKTPERHQQHHSCVFIFNIEEISQLVSMFLLLILNRYLSPGQNGL